RVSEVLLNTSAPTGNIDRTARLACSPESSTRVVTPLRSSAAAAVRIWWSEANPANSDTAASLGAAIAGGVFMSLTTEFGEALMHQRHRHRSLTDGRRAALDRAAAHVAGGEQPG